MSMFSVVSQVIKDNLSVRNLRSYVDSAVRGVRILFDHENPGAGIITAAACFFIVGAQACQAYLNASGDGANCSEIFSRAYDVKVCQSAIRQIEPIVRYACEHFFECAKAARTVLG